MQWEVPGEAKLSCPSVSLGARHGACAPLSAQRRNGQVPVGPEYPGSPLKPLFCMVFFSPPRTGSAGADKAYVTTRITR